MGILAHSLLYPLLKTCLRERRLGSDGAWGRGEYPRSPTRPTETMLLCLRAQGDRFCFYGLVQDTHLHCRCPPSPFLTSTSQLRPDWAPSSKVKVLLNPRFTIESVIFLFPFIIEVHSVLFPFPLSCFYYAFTDFWPVLTHCLQHMVRCLCQTWRQYKVVHALMRVALIV